MRLAHLAIASVFMISCHVSQKPESIGKIDSSPETQKPVSVFSRLKDVDSLVFADVFFLKATIDSIATSEIFFPAKYMSCAKASIHNKNYAYLAKTANSTYEKLCNIHTQHVLMVDSIERSFEGIGRFNCYETPKGTPVNAFGKVFSMYSSRTLIGRIIILDSILNVSLNSNTQK